MVVDSSAWVAIPLGEPEGDALALALPDAAEAQIGDRRNPRSTKILSICPNISSARS
ncbi:hypothetical protein [Accumulibacter sp.]|uniref:hypothetical protein n=1 Tax=Accumulibacter sp. TaxID=2053492 RepID=UPI0026159B1C|nr:hypothetical protein [Accumulibacter sp.]